MIEIDHLSDIETACQIVDEDITIWGNLDPVGLLSRGTVEEINRKTRDLFHTFEKHGRRRFVLSSGCTLAVETPAENLHAFIDTARNLAASIV